MRIGRLFFAVSKVFLLTQHSTPQLLQLLTLLFCNTQQIVPGRNSQGNNNRQHQN